MIKRKLEFLDLISFLKYEEKMTSIEQKEWETGLSLALLLH